MTSQTDIANLALTKLGAASITTLDEGTYSADVLRSLYAPAVDALLRAHLWAFSRARAVLPQMADTPGFGYAAHYPLPADCLRVLAVGQAVGQAGSGAGMVVPDTAPRYVIEGRRILINHSGPLPLTYVRRVEDPNLFDALFVQALACQLALDACERLTQSNTKKQALAQELERTLITARRVNAIERPAIRPADDSWLAARL